MLQMFNQYYYVLFIAEKCLESIEGKQNYPLLLLNLVDKDGVDMTLRVAGAVTI